MNTTDFNVIEEVNMGKNVALHNFVNLYGCSIGDNSKIGAFVEIQKGVVVGRNCKISSHSFICEGVTIEEGVFIGHGVIFINDKYPRAAINGRLQTQADWKLLLIKVEHGASIGSGAIILGGVTIGAEAIIGAGAVVTKDVAPRMVVVGNPARVLRSL